MAFTTGSVVLLLLIGRGSTDAPSRFSVLHAPGYVNFLETSASLPAREVGAVSAFALGLAPSKTLTWDGLSPGSLFHRPKSNILFLLDGVAADSHVGLAALRSSPLVVDSHAQASQAVHAVASGKNLASHVSDLFHGTPLTLSMSSNKDAAVAGAGGGKNSVTMFYDHAGKQVQTMPASSAFAMNSEELLNHIAAIQLPAGLKFDKEQGAVMSAGTPVLSMSSKEGASFLAELASMHKVLSSLFAHPELVTDNVPDVLTFSVSALKDLHIQFGSDSPQVKAAMDILSSFIPQSASSLSMLYKGDAIVELVEVGFNGELHKAITGDIPALFDALKSHTKAQTLSTFRAALPHIPLQSRASREVACQEGANLLVSLSSNFEIDCTHPYTGDKHSGRHLLELVVDNISYAGNSSDFNLAYERSAEWTAAFTMFLIVFLIFTLSALAISHTLWTMDPGSDSIIYRMTNQRIKME